MEDPSKTNDGGAQTLRVSVKWQKKTFPVEIDATQSPFLFKCQLFDLTGVPPERQKIMVKGGLLKDDADWAAVGIKEGQKLMMMGTADEIVNAPEKGPVFVEDLPEEEQALNLGYSAGLFNLGNTCYMNSTIQCLHSVPELKSALLEYSQSGRSNDLDQTSHLLTVATKDLFSELDKNAKPVAPMQFWMILRKKFPQFGQLHNGAFMQQDAEECWTQLLYTLSQSLKSSIAGDNLSAVKALFGVDLASSGRGPDTDPLSDPSMRIGSFGLVESENKESNEAVDENLESDGLLRKYRGNDKNRIIWKLKQWKESRRSLEAIEGEVLEDEDLGLFTFDEGLKSELEKNSPTLGRTAIYFKESRISGLPRYLTIQFVRFFWKRESNQKAKILRKVDYPLELDVFELCSDELKKKLESPRQILRDEEGVKLGLKPSEKSSSSKDKDIKMVDVEVSPNGCGESSSGTSQGASLCNSLLHLRTKRGITRGIETDLASAALFRTGVIQYVVKYHEQQDVELESTTFGLQATMQKRDIIPFARDQHLDAKLDRLSTLL
ncbi:hypothetical protein KSS87_003567 [Heliosperma pusillum]|nr:hypothetical protein KSS87_003567 [Heliosperma pusillum]